MRLRKSYGDNMSRWLRVGLASFAVVGLTIAGCTSPVYADSSSHNQQVNVTITNPQVAIEIIDIVYSRDQNGVLHAKVRVRYHNATKINLSLDGHEIASRNVPYSNGWATTEFDIILPNTNHHALLAGQ